MPMVYFCLDHLHDSGEGKRRLGHPNGGSETHRRREIGLSREADIAKRAEEGEARGNRVGYGERSSRELMG